MSRSFREAVHSAPDGKRLRKCVYASRRFWDETRGASGGILDALFSDRCRGLTISYAAPRIANFKNPGITHAHFIRLPRFLFVAGTGVPFLQQRNQKPEKKGKGKRDHESGDTERTLRKRTSRSVQCREPINQSVAEDGERRFIR